MKPSEEISEEISEELRKEYRDLHSYVIRRIADYGKIVAEETEEHDPLKHGMVIAEIATDIIRKMEDFTIHFLHEQVPKS